MTKHIAKAVVVLAALVSIGIGISQAVAQTPPDGPVQRDIETVPACSVDASGAKRCDAARTVLTEVQEVSGKVETRTYTDGLLTETRPATQAETDSYNTFKAGQDAEAEAQTADAVIADWQDTKAPQDAQRLADCQAQWALLDPLGKDACMQEIFGITLRLMGVMDTGLDQKVDVSVTAEVPTGTPVLPTATVSVPTVGISESK